MASGRDDQNALGQKSLTRPMPESGVICAAPSVTMEFGAYGLVQACCANAMYPIGDVRYQTVDEIWNGDRAARLRASLNQWDLSTGCGVCRFRMAHTPGELPRNYYDLFGFGGGDRPHWPRILTFSLHNTCNLECVMCGGDESSRIRSRRDGLPPLPHVYSDRFFDELVPYLQHCEFADFVGGEPFLVPEHQRVWDLLIAQDEPVKCSATTNGTVWNDRVERVLDQIDFQITVSVDGITPETFESIRRGADFHEVYSNIERFRRYTNQRGTPFSISWSLMRQNWHELGRMLEWADERDISVKVQTVMEPEFGIQALPTTDLVEVVGALEAEDQHVRPRLGRNLEMWTRELDRLRDELQSRREPVRKLRAMRGPAYDNVTHVIESLMALPDARSDGNAARVDALLEPWRDAQSISGRFVLTDSGEVMFTEGLEGTNAETWRTQPFSTVLQELAGGVAGGVWLLEEFDSDDLLEHLLFLGPKVRDKQGLVARMVSEREPGGSIAVNLVLSYRLAGALPLTIGNHPPAEVPVLLRTPWR